jgi:hypothetical protein
VGIAPSLRRLWRGKAGRNAALITGVVGPDKEGGWSAFFVSEGLELADVRGWTLTEVADNACAAVAALYAQYPAVEGAELQLAIYAWDYNGGPIFDVTGQSGQFVARDLQGSDLAVEGATLEDLLEAMTRLGPPSSPDSMLRWIQPIAALRVPPISPLSA